jgi:hypothetical protein
LGDNEAIQQDAGNKGANKLAGHRKIGGEYFIFSK